MKKEQRQELMNIIINEYLETPENFRSLTKLGNKYGVKRQTISKYLKERGIKVINYQNRIRLDDSVFDNINTEEKAYWLGFLYADGNISSTGNRLEVHLSIKDINHLEKFRKFLKLETEFRTGYYNGNAYCHLSVRNKHLWEQLNNKGCTPRKTLTLDFPDLNIFENKNLVYDFIRGYVDGNGCLFTKKYKYNVTQILILGTEKFLYGIRNFLNEPGYIRSCGTKNFPNKAFKLYYSNFPSRIIARKLYEHSTIYLDRKYNKYKYFCQLEEESSNMKSSKIGES